MIPPILLLSMVVSFLVAFVIGYKWKRWLLLIPLFLLGGAIGFGFSLLQSAMSTQGGTGAGGIGAAMAAPVLVIIGIIVFTIFSSISALIGGTIGIAVGKKLLAEDYKKYWFVRIVAY